MEITEAACVCDELCRLKEEDGDKIDSEFRRFAYKACTGSLAYGRRTRARFYSKS